MHREIRDHIENVLAGSEPEHLAGCDECRSEVRGMQEHTALLRELRAPASFVAEPRAGFYARVMERIEAEGPISIWNLFIESAFGRRIALASMALAILLGVYLVTSERSAVDPMIAGQQAQQQPLVVVGEDGPARILMQMDQSAAGQSSEDAVLADLVSYREQ